MLYICMKKLLREDNVVHLISSDSKFCSPPPGKALVTTLKSLPKWVFML